MPITELQPDQLLVDNEKSNVPFISLLVTEEPVKAFNYLTLFLHADKNYWCRQKYKMDTLVQLFA